MYLDEHGTSIQQWSPENGEVHLMHALGIEAMLKREGKAVTDQQPGVGQPAGLGYSQPGYAQGMQGYSQPGFVSQPAPSAPYGMADGGPMTPPPAYSDSKEKF